MIDALTAHREIKSTFWNAWKAMDFASLGLAAVPLVQWWDLDDGTLPDPQAPFARFSLKVLTDPQVTFRGPFQQKRRFSATGIVTVQVFTPTSSRNGSTLNQKLAIIAQAAYRVGSSPSGVWFRDVVAKPIGSDGAGWFQTNVSATFNYDTEQ